MILTKETDVGLADVPPPRPVLWRRHEHWFADSRIIQVGFGIRKGDAVIRAVDYQGIIFMTSVLQLLEN